MENFGVQPLYMVNMLDLQGNWVQSYICIHDLEMLANLEFQTLHF